MNPKFANVYLSTCRDKTKSCSNSTKNCFTTILSCLINYIYLQEFNCYASERKRWITFADELGGDLYQTKLISNNPYDTPIFGSPMARAISRVSGEENNNNNNLRLSTPQTPVDSVDSVINNIVDLTFHSVQLEFASIVKSHLLELRGCVKVKNFALEKEVTIRVTRDDWKTVEDFKAHYVPALHQNVHDSFAFLIGLSPVNCDRVQFCVRFRVGPNKQELWDNNGGQNYLFNVATVKNIHPKPKLVCPAIVTPDNNFNASPKTWDNRRW